MKINIKFGNIKGLLLIVIIMSSYSINLCSTVTSSRSRWFGKKKTAKVEEDKKENLPQTDKSNDILEGPAPMSDLDILDFSVGMLCITEQIMSIGFGIPVPFLIDICNSTEAEYLSLIADSNSEPENYCTKEGFNNKIIIKKEELKQAAKDGQIELQNKLADKTNNIGDKFGTLNPTVSRNECLKRVKEGHPLLQKYKDESDQKNKVFLNWKAKIEELYEDKDNKLTVKKFMEMEKKDLEKVSKTCKNDKIYLYEHGPETPKAYCEELKSKANTWVVTTEAAKRIKNAPELKAEIKKLKCDSYPKKKFEPEEMPLGIGGHVKVAFTIIGLATECVFKNNSKKLIGGLVIRIAIAIIASILTGGVMAILKIAYNVIRCLQKLYLLIKAYKTLKKEWKKANKKKRLKLFLDIAINIGGVVGFGLKVATDFGFEMRRKRLMERKKLRISGKHNKLE